jgi:hypothetical protein
MSGERECGGLCCPHEVLLGKGQPLHLKTETGRTGSERSLEQCAKRNVLREKNYFCACVFCDSGNS